MENRFQIARDHLLDLLKYYGNRTILVKITQDGKEVKEQADDEKADNKEGDSEKKSDNSEKTKEDK